MTPPSTATIGLAIVPRFSDWVLASAAVPPVAAVASEVSSAPACIAPNRPRRRLVVSVFISSPLVISTLCRPKRCHSSFPPGRGRRTRQLTGDYPCPTTSEETGQSTGASGEARAQYGSGRFANKEEECK